MASYRRPLHAAIGIGRAARHARDVKSGNRSVSVALFSFAALHAADAGRVGESGSGAMWIAPELVQVQVQMSAPVQPCSATASLRTRQLVFETLEPGGEEPGLPPAAGREVVSFEWNPRTGELYYHTRAPTGIFSDLVAASPASDPRGPSCE